MIVRTLKLRLIKGQEAELERWPLHLGAIYNWGLRKIELNAKDRIYFSQHKFQNLLEGCGKKLDIPGHAIQGTLVQIYGAWQKCFHKLAKKPRFKGRRNKMNSVPFPDPILPPVDGRISVPGLGRIRFRKQELPVAKIKCGRIVHRASGWYMCLWLDTETKFDVKDTRAAIGIDPGFHTLLTLSDGIKIENPRELRVGAHRLAQVRRGHNRQLTASLQERQANRRSDRNHKISRKLVENYHTICYSDDNFSAMARGKFGKSVAEAALGNLIGMLGYKSRTGGRTLIPVRSNFTTMTCSACGALTGPTGLGGLAVRFWRCSACGAVHDRDTNAAMVVLKTGLGTSHESQEAVYAVA